jgi:hypothetical protein
MSKSLLDSTYDLMADAYARGLTQRQVAEGAGVGYWWFIKFSQRSIPNPTVNNVQAVHDYLIRARDRAA